VEIESGHCQEPTNARGSAENSWASPTADCHRSGTDDEQTPDSISIPCWDPQNPYYRTVTKIRY
jgi:hypothetical protein